VGRLGLERRAFAIAGRGNHGGLMSQLPIKPFGIVGVETRRPDVGLADGIVLARVGVLVFVAKRIEQVLLFNVRLAVCTGLSQLCQASWIVALFLIL